MKTYTIGQAAERAGLSADTLRYYDKQGLLPFVARAENGYRVFTEEDFAWLDTIACLKGTGMELKDIRTFIRWCMQGGFHAAEPPGPHPRPQARSRIPDLAAARVLEQARAEDRPLPPGAGRRSPRLSASSSPPCAQFPSPRLLQMS